MKYVIDFGSTKREIGGPFGICGSRADLAIIAECIRAALADDGWAYGWVAVYERHKGSSDQKPIGWED